MPEGDTIHRAARALGAALAGRAVERFESALPAVAAKARRLRIAGRQIESVEARGKHLLVHFGGGPVLHTHQRMAGSWHLYRPGSRWRKPAYLARAVVAVESAVAVCFSSPVVELLTPAELARHPSLAALGPDVLGEQFAAEDAAPRLGADPRRAIASALLDQQTLAGIGNIYKSETLFLCGVDPFTACGELDAATLARIASTASGLMRRNLTTASRVTTLTPATGRFWVYRRARQPCRRCGTPIRREVQGEERRSTYWCPTCQR